MKDIADKVDRLGQLITERHMEGKRYDRTVEEEQIMLSFVGELVANSRRIAVALGKLGEAKIELNFENINHGPLEDLAYNLGTSFERGKIRA